MTAEPDGAAGEFGNVLAALADPTRRRLLDLLAAQGAATATTLARRLPSPGRRSSNTLPSWTPPDSSPDAGPDAR